MPRYAAVGREDVVSRPSGRRKNLDETVDFGGCRRVEPGRWQRIRAVLRARSPHAGQPTGFAPVRSGGYARPRRSGGEAFGQCLKYRHGGRQLGDATASPGLCATPMSPGPITTQGAIACRIDASVPNGAVVAACPADLDAMPHERMIGRQFRRRALLRLGHRRSRAAPPPRAPRCGSASGRSRRSSGT